MSDATRANGEVPGGGLSGAEALDLSAQLAGLARAGLPLGPSLAALAEELPRGRLRRAMRDLVRGLDSGLPLGDAVDGQAGRLPPHLRGLVTAGVRSGRLGEVLGEFSHYAASGIELRRRLLLNLAYPVLSLLIGLAVFAFIGIAVLPGFEAIFRDFGVPLPIVTIALFRFAASTAAIWPTLAAVAGVTVVCALAARLFLRPATARGLAGRVPLLGGVWRWSSLAEFFHLLGLLLEYRLPMPEALRLAGVGVQDSAVDKAARFIAQEVEDGESLAQGMSRRREFPPRLPRLVRWAENQGTLPEVLHMAGELFAARASSHATIAATAVSVACFFVIILGIALCVVALMVPLITLIYRLSG